MEIQFVPNQPFRYRPLACVALFLLVSIIAVTPALATDSRDDWPQFRGPFQDGRSVATDVFGDSVGLEVSWSRDLGSGYSGIAVVEGRVVTFFTDGIDDLLGAFDAETGDEIWRLKVAAMYAGHDGSDDGPLSSPTVADGVVYALGAWGDLVAARLDDGQEVWRRKLEEGEKSRKPEYGYTTSPVVVDDILVVLTGGPGTYAVSGFSRDSGSLRWAIGDDTVAYQTPTVMDLDGRRQVVAVTNHELVGIDPRNGERLWRHEHHPADAVHEGSGQPVKVGDDGIVVTFENEAAMYRVTNAVVSEVWRSGDLKRTYGMPIYHEGHLYGFNGRFLTAVDATTGKVAWKSRPPGGLGSMTLVDDHLLIVGAQGNVVVAKAQPTGYEEMARVPVFSTQTYTAPSFAGGAIFVRDLEKMARVDITDEAASLAETLATTELSGVVGELAHELNAVPFAERKTRAAAWVAAQASMPVVEQSGLTHFILHDDLDDAAVTGNFFQPGVEESMTNLPGTDMWVYSLELDPESVYEYRFNTNFGTVVTDPSNPLTLGSVFGRSSELRMPRWRAPSHVVEPSAETARGRIDSFKLTSAVNPDPGEREIRVYLPPGYDDSAARYPLVLFNNGDSALDQAALDHTLDNLIASGELAPVIVALLSRVRGEFVYDQAELYPKIVAEEILPALEKRYRVISDPSARAIIGAASGGSAAVNVAVQRPGLFSKVGSQSAYLPAQVRLPLMSTLKTGSAPGGEFWVGWCRYDYDFGDIRSAKDSKEMADALRTAGANVSIDLAPGAAGWASWRARYGDLLTRFFPGSGG
ncbi:MAG: PQQ-binding-like beta-propeller repeat protein [Acidobacteriota bacterium]